MQNPKHVDQKRVKGQGGLQDSQQDEQQVIQVKLENSQDTGMPKGLIKKEQETDDANNQ